MKIVIIEDEKAAVRNLTSLLNEIKPNGEIVTILDSISSTIEWFSSYPMSELVFMDIHLADGSAFEIFNHINITCPIIFTTAYDEYALRAFKVNSIDYLLKPIGKEDIEHAFDKLQGLQDAADKHQFPFPQQENELLKLIHSLQKQENYKSHFLIPTKGDKLLPVSVDMIQLFYIKDCQVKVVLTDETEYCFSQTLDELTSVSILLFSFGLTANILFREKLSKILTYGSTADCPSTCTIQESKKKYLSVKPE